MSSGRLLWGKDFEPSLIPTETLPELRKQYGADIERIVEDCRDLVRDFKPPEMKSVKRTLEAIRDGRRPKGELEGLTTGLLWTQSNRKYQREPEALSVEQLRECADSALAELAAHPHPGGAATSNPFVTNMVIDLVCARPAFTGEERFELVRAALQACGRRSKDDSVKKQLEAASRMARQRGQPLPRAQRKDHPRKRAG